jgi:tetratricopeptide (TPR) repeat protein
LAQSLQAGFAEFMVGDYENALAFHAKSFRLGKESGQLFNSAAAAASMVRIYVELGMDGEEAAQLRSSALGYLEGPTGETLASTVYAELGWAAIERCSLEDAAEMFALGIAGQSASKLLELPTLLLGLATVRTAAGNPAGTEALISEASDFIDDRGMAWATPALAAARGNVLMVTDRHSEAGDVLRAGAEAAHEMGIAGIEWRLRAARAGALALAGQADAAIEETAKARRLVAVQADRIINTSTRGTFLQAATAHLSNLADVPTT